MSIYDFKVLDRKGNEVSIGNFEGKVLLIVNTATGCGFTPQYKELEELYEKYHDQGLEILDFPCNQFHEQAKGTDDEIHEFCTLKYKTQFDQFKKIEVNGENELPLYTFLKKEQGYKKPKGIKNGLIMGQLEKLSDTKDSDDIKWNFTKFLVDRSGEVVNRYEPVEKIRDIEKAIKELLK